MFSPTKSVRHARVVVGAFLLCGLANVGQAEDATVDGIDFSRHIRPILSDKCLKCHGPDESQREAGLRLDGDHITRTESIVAGDVDASEFIRRIVSDNPDEQMPPPDSKLTLSAAEIDLLRRWVAAGASYLLHWSFVKATRPAVPQLDTDHWKWNEIDAFVWKRLAAASVKPAPEASKVSLIRRLSLDLRGLPPTIGEVDRFLEDKRTGAYSRLVDRFLASQHYGERMAQDWLDLARYGDTNGYENDSDREMWLYRDWVINAFNTNKPYDQFTVEQIAGDLLPDADPSQVIASGFNRNTTYNEEGGADPDEFQVAYAVERASTTATVFLGLTMGCAQCHEHKYDPISQKEFYQFYAFFNSVDGEKGAMGHDIPLPPLLTLPTNQQAADLNATSAALEEVTKRITVEVGKVRIEKTTAVAADVPATIGTTTKGEEQTKKGEEKRYFDDQVSWEDYEKKREKSPVPKEIRDILQRERVERDDAQNKKLRDYFIVHAYSKTREIFEPLVTEQGELTKRKKKLETEIDTTMVMKEMAERRPAFVLMRGDFEQPGEEVEPDVPAIFPRLPAAAPRNRLGLARWLVDAGNPLVARVAVNRYWTQFFGTGLVKTMEDFGVRGEYPSHPELLDWLATELVRTDWNVKALQKKIVMSATYRQESNYRSDLAAVDPYNRLLSRQNRFRLTAEEIHDTALVVSGLWNDQVGGPSVYPYQPTGYYKGKGRWEWTQSEGADLYRRGLYTFWRRTTFYPSFQIFDAPSRETCTVERPRTNTPLQALVTLNDPRFVEAARVFGERILQFGGASLQEKVVFAFRTVLTRSPEEHERTTLIAAFQEQRQKYAADTEAAAALVQQGEYRVQEGLDVPSVAAWTTMANVLLNLDEAITRE